MEPPAQQKKPGAGINNDIDNIVSIKLGPNPAKSILNIYTTGLPKNKQITLSVIAASGVKVKTIKIAGSTQSIQLNVSSLVSGIYTIKIVNRGKVIYKKFVKL